MAHWHRPLMVCLGLPPFGPLAAQDPSPVPPQIDQDLIALLNTPVISASSSREKLSEAPATIVVVRREELERRGYHDLLDLFNDLPGMQLSRAQGGDMIAKSYWRGFRNQLSDSYLFMVDGLVFNQLWDNATNGTMAALPLSNVERVEVVYGPASAVYGANAFMGVVNVITRTGAEGGSHHDVSLSAGSNGLRTMDAASTFASGAIRFTLATKFTASRVDTSKADAYEYTRSRYHEDRLIWGAFLDHPRYGGNQRYANSGKALDLRMYMDQTELGFQFYNFLNTYGFIYPTDKALPGAWNNRELSLHLRQQMTLGERLKGTFVARYRESGNPGEDNWFIERYPNPAGIQGIDYDIWQNHNTSLALTQRFDLQASPRTSFNFGLTFERKDLQKAYENPTGPWVPASQLTDLGSYAFPAVPTGQHKAQNRIVTEDRAFFLQGKFRLDEHHILILGGRSDTSARYGSNTTLRLGYVGSFGPLGLKALYGEGVMEPDNHALYSQWAAGSGDPNLGIQTSRTMEVMASYTKTSWSLLGSLWQARNTNIVVPAYPTFLNLGETKVSGLDLHAQCLFFPHGTVREVKVWGYASQILDSSGSNRPDSQGIRPTVGLTRSGEVADLARTQFRLGVTAGVQRLFLTLLAQHVGSRQTVATNPIGTVGAYTSLDVVALYPDLAGIPGLDLRVKVANLADRTYFHPGPNDASAGLTPGAFSGQDRWQGSAGWYSSLLPQPGRTFTVTVSFRQ